MTKDELFALTLAALDELTRQVSLQVRIAIKSAGDQSQQFACLWLALRAASLFRGAGQMLTISTLDSHDVLVRAAIEARYLLAEFRFEDAETRKKIQYWFSGKGEADTSWKANFSKIENLLTNKGFVFQGLSEHWSELSVLSHPTHYAANNSVKCTTKYLFGNQEESEIQFVICKKKEFAVQVSQLIRFVLGDISGWIPLGLELSRLQKIPLFMELAKEIRVEDLREPIPNVQSLPDHAIRQKKQKVPKK